MILSWKNTDVVSNDVSEGTEIILLAENCYELQGGVLQRTGRRHDNTNIGQGHVRNLESRTINKCSMMRRMDLNGVKMILEERDLWIIDSASNTTTSKMNSNNTSTMTKNNNKNKNTTYKHTIPIVQDIDNATTILIDEISILTERDVPTEISFGVDDYNNDETVDDESKDDTTFDDLEEDDEDDDIMKFTDDNKAKIFVVSRRSLIESGWNGMERRTTNTQRNTHTNETNLSVGDVVYRYGDSVNNTFIDDTTFDDIDEDTDDEERDDGMISTDDNQAKTFDCHVSSNEVPLTSITSSSLTSARSFIESGRNGVERRNFIKSSSRMEKSETDTTKKNRRRLHQIFRRSFSKQLRRTRCSKQSSTKLEYWRSKEYHPYQWKTTMDDNNRTNSGRPKALAEENNRSMEMVFYETY